MKWRIANKILAAIGTDRDGAYTEAQKDRALDRYARLRSSKEDSHCWDGLMRYFGPAGRAQLLARDGRPDLALSLLMRTPEEEWPGDPSAWPFARPVSQMGQSPPK